MFRGHAVYEIANFIQSFVPIIMSNNNRLKSLDNKADNLSSLSNHCSQDKNSSRSSRDIFFNMFNVNIRFRTNLEPLTTVNGDLLRAGSETKNKIDVTFKIT